MVAGKIVQRSIPADGPKGTCRGGGENWKGYDTNISILTLTTSLVERSTPYR